MSTNLARVALVWVCVVCTSACSSTDTPAADTTASHDVSGELTPVGDATRDGEPADSALPDGDLGLASLPLLTESDLQYVGSFRLPEGESGNDPNGFSYSSAFMAGNVYYDAAQGDAPTLFISGYLSAGYIGVPQSLAQVSIPALHDIDAVGLEGLETATLLQPFADPTAGHNPLTGPGFCSYVVYAESLLGFCAVAYDASGSLEATAFVNSSLTLSSPDAAGPYAMGSISQDMFGGYAALVPEQWQAALGTEVVVGNGPWSIISVNSAGPGLHTVDVDALISKPAAGTVLESTPLAYYPTGQRQLGEWDSNMPDQVINGVPVPTATVTDPEGRTGIPGDNGSGPTWTIPYNDSGSRVRGALFADGTRSVLFFGKKSLGPYCYGQGTSDVALAGTTDSSGAKYCYDPENDSKGDHGYPYAPFVWAYDVNEYVAAKNGLKEPWMVFPYAGWTMKRGDGGVAWDPKTRRLYVAALCEDPGGGYFCGPLIDVYQVGP